MGDLGVMESGVDCVGWGKGENKTGMSREGGAIGRGEGGKQEGGGFGPARLAASLGNPRAPAAAADSAEANACWMMERHSTRRLKEETGVSGEGDRGIEGEGWADGGDCSRSVENEATNESMSCLVWGEGGDSSAASLVDSQPSSDSEFECGAKDAERGWILSVAEKAPAACG